MLSSPLLIQRTIPEFDIWIKVRLYERRTFLELSLNFPRTFLETAQLRVDRLEFLYISICKLNTTSIFVYVAMGHKVKVTEKNT